MQIIKETSIDFIGKRKIAIAISMTLILIGIVSLIIKGGPKLGIDFSGGTSLQLKFEKPVDVGQIRGILSNIGFGNIEIKEFGAKDEILIRLQQTATSGDVSTIVINELRDKLPDNKLEIRMSESVGPRIGSELKTAAVWATLVSLLLILIYISWRFELVFAVGAVVALFHDVMITLGFFSVLNLEMSLVVLAAFLTLVGYSLNDTIVVYDRIRENLKLMRKEDTITIFNKSVNQTLSRTLLTGTTTIMVVIILFFFGGEVIHGFSFALLVGMLVGTYSSIYIASPVVVEWRLRAEKARQR